jgi:hypothetical protein
MVKNLKLACDAINRPSEETFDALVDHMDNLELELAYALNALWDTGIERCPAWPACSNPTCSNRKKMVTG